jgi:hypothetical protein
MKIGKDGEVRISRPEAGLGQIFYESAWINAVIAK